MRIKNSLINITMGIGNQLIITILSFVSRTVFISSLGAEYLGLNGLLTNVLGMLTLVEAGLGASIMYSLYKPISMNNIIQIKTLMNFYRKAYLVIAIIVTILGLSLLPFLPLILKETNIENIYVIYLIFLLNTVAPYLYIHKNSFLNVCQKGYIVTGIYSISTIVTTALKIWILHTTSNYILYLIIESSVIIFTSVCLAILVNRMYPYLREKVSTKLDTETRKGITKNVKAMVLQNIGNYLVVGTDNIIIASFVSVTAVGLYSNYNMLIEISRTFINQIFNNIYHSVGNLVAKENTEKVYSIYKTYRLLNFWLYSVSTIFLIIMLEPFINLWLGQEFLLESNLIYILMFIFFERGMRNSITTLKTTSGIFHEDRYAPLCQAVINLVVSITLVQKIGITGVFIGTLVSALAVPFWLTPYLVYKKVFSKPISSYIRSYTVYLVTGFVVYLITKYTGDLIIAHDIKTLILKAVISLTIPNIIYILIYHKTEEFKYLYGIAKGLFQKIFNLVSLKKQINNVG